MSIKRFPQSLLSMHDLNARETASERSSINSRENFAVNEPSSKLSTSTEKGSVCLTRLIVIRDHLVSLRREEISRTMNNLGMAEDLFASISRLEEIQSAIRTVDTAMVDEIRSANA